MKIKLSKLVIVSGLLILSLIGLLLVSFNIGQDTADKIGYLVNLISGLSTILTLIIALLLFEKYGLDKKIEEKTHDLVLELLDSLTEISFSIETNFNGGSKHYSYRPISDYKFDFKYFDGKEILFSKLYFEKISELNRYKNNYWLPSSIKTAIGDTQAITILYHNDVNAFSDKYVRIGIRFTEESQNKEIYGKLAHEYDIQIFCKKWEKVHEEIICWLNKNSEFKIKR